MALRTIYCVQSYGGAPGQMVKGVLRQFGTLDEAQAKAAELRDRVPGVLVFSVTGEPDFDFWEEPTVVAAHGRVPRI